jgi:hypothetical protein
MRVWAVKAHRENLRFVDGESKFFILESDQDYLNFSISRSRKILSVGVIRRRRPCVQVEGDIITRDVRNSMTEE